ncbi:MAG: CBS domain-containing protein [Lentimicrobiaceae bacterium]|nr:CBS domain-containing protein [Lentimicrobiaceae bacterium]
MIAIELIHKDFLPLRTTDTAIIALNWMDEYRISHLPVVNNEEYVGLISDTEIYNLSEFEQPVGNHLSVLAKHSILHNQHFYEVLKAITLLKISMLPVVDEKNHYLGSILFSDLVYKFSEFISAPNPGTIFVLEMNINDYSLNEISFIVESNDAKILSSCVTTHPDSMKVEVTLKINRMDFMPVLQSFNRHEYFVKAYYGESEYFDDLKDRYDALMNYLNI